MNNIIELAKLTERHRYSLSDLDEQSAETENGSANQRQGWPLSPIGPKTKKW